MKAKKKRLRPAVAYFRAFKNEKGILHPRLEAKRVALQSFCNVNEYRILSTHQDFYSSKHGERKGIDAALQAAKATRALLIFPKMGRLRYDLDFLFQLESYCVEFKALDLPEASTKTLGNMSSDARLKNERISSRIKAGMAAAKARGVKFGAPNPKFNEAARVNAKAAIRANAIAYHNGNIKIAVDYRKMGWTLAKIAQKLNEAGARTRQGKLFSPKQVARLLELSKPTNELDPRIFKAFRAHQAKGHQKANR
jgi:DNA invertase Pin-like site-specific DNA recombinase